MLSSPPYNAPFLPPQTVISPVEGVADKAIFHRAKIISLAVHNQTLAIGLLNNSKPTENLHHTKVVKACYCVHYDM